MDKHNLIIILDDNITEIDATDNVAKILTFSGEPSIVLNDNSCIDNAVNNILSKFGLSDLSDDEISIVIINNGADAEYISKLFVLVSKVKRVNIIDWEMLMPMLVQCKGLSLPAKIAFNNRNYLVEQCKSSMIGYIKENTVIYDDLLFLFNFQTMGSNADNTELQKTAQCLQATCEKQKKNIATLKKEKKDLSDLVEELRSENAELQAKASSFAVEDEPEHKARLNDFVDGSVSLNSFSIAIKEESTTKASVIVQHNKTGMMLKIPDKSTKKSSGSHELAAAFAIAKLQEIVPYSLNYNNGWWANQVGKLIRFGKIDGNPLEWRVLKVEQGKTLLLLEPVLEQVSDKPIHEIKPVRKAKPSFSDNSKSEKGIKLHRRFDDKGKTNRWSQCSLRYWLNRDFLAVFSDEEAGRILDTSVVTGRSRTQDKLFLLSQEELDAFLPDECARGAEFAWWLRSTQPYNRCSVVNTIGKVRISEANDFYCDRGAIYARPAMWITI